MVNPQIGTKTPNKYFINYKITQYTKKIMIFLKKDPKKIVNYKIDWGIQINYEKLP